MSAVAEASMLLGELAEPHPPSRKALFSRMTKLVRRYAGYDLSPGRAEDIWRQEARRVDAEEMDAIRAAKQRHQEDQARAQANALAAIYLSRAARLRQTDEAFHCEEIARLERAAGALGAVSRP